MSGYKLLAARGGGSMIVEGAFALAGVPLEVEYFSWTDLGLEHDQLRAVNPLRAEPRASLRGTPILLIAGASDPIAPPGLSEDLAATLRNQGAETSFRTLTCGHALTDHAVDAKRFDQ